MEARTNFEGSYSNGMGKLLTFLFAFIQDSLMAEQAREQCLCPICVLLKVLEDMSKKKKILGENQGTSSLSCDIMSCLCKYTKRWDPPSVVTVLLLRIRLSAGQFVIKGKKGPA